MKTINVIHSSFLALILVSICIISACQKGTIVGSDPYAGGKVPFGIKFTGDAPIPSSGPAGSIVVFKINGLKKYEGKFTFLVNSETATVQTVTDTTVTIKIPVNVSSGICSVQYNGQIFFGPRFTVTGNVSIDPNFGVVNGSGGPIYDYNLTGQNYLLVGNFRTYEGKTAGGIAQINTQGVVSTTLNSGVGTTGTILSIGRFADGKYIIAGNFTNYNKRFGINNITRLNSDGSLDTRVVNVINLQPDVPKNGLDTVPNFNGGAVDKQAITKVFITSKNKVIAIGGFRTYGKIIYEQSTRLSRYYQYTTMVSAMQMNEDGVLDSTYNYGSSGANGSVFDGALQTGDKLVMVGNFTQFNAKAASRIVRLDAAGNFDPTFNNGGAGADGDITTIRYTASLKKFVITGSFTKYNGVAANGIMVLNDDGTPDPSFSTKTFSDGQPNYGQILSTGKIVVSGTFTKYDNVTRRGFLLLNADGSISQDFNVAGSFEGQIAQVIETTSALGKPAFILLGYIRRFDDQVTGNIIRIQVTN